MLCRAADVSPSAYKRMPLLSIPELERLGQKRAQEQQAARHLAVHLLQPLVELTNVAVSCAESQMASSSSSSSQTEQQWPGSPPDGSAAALAADDRVSCDSSSSSNSDGSSSGGYGSSGSPITQYGRCGIITSSDGREESSWSWSWTDGSSGSADFYVHEVPAQQAPSHPAPPESATQHVPKVRATVGCNPHSAQLICPFFIVNSLLHRM